MDTLSVKVWKLDFSEFKSPAAARVVALAIARRSRESGLCWAKQTTLADDCSISAKTVHRVLCELEEHQPPWVKRVERRRKDGSRTSDYIWLTLPEVVLEADTVTDNWRSQVDAVEGEKDGQADTTTGHEGKLDGSRSPLGTVRESEQKDSLKDSEKKGSMPAGADSNGHDDVKAAVDLIWKRASDQGRKRSSKADIEVALRAALGRGHSMERILRGMRGYFESPDATKDDGAYQSGPHVKLAKDRWESFLDDDQARRAIREDTPEADAARAVTGTLERPSPALQRTWMELFVQGGAWNPDRGPQPGRLGCRVDDALQREFGVEPYAPPASTDDAAFD